MKKEDIIKRLLDRRGSEFTLKDTKEEYDLEELVTFTHRHPLIDNKFCHDIRVKLKHLMFRSFMCPVCYPEYQHNYGAELIKQDFVFENFLTVLEQDVEINGHVFDVLLDDKRTIIHYFDHTYFNDFIRGSDELNAIMEFFETTEEYDLIPFFDKDLYYLKHGERITIEE